MNNVESLGLVIVRVVDTVVVRRQTRDRMTAVGLNHRDLTSLLQHRQAIANYAEDVSLQLLVSNDPYALEAERQWSFGQETDVRCTVNT